MNASANANGPRYFLSYSGVSLPLRLVSPLKADELQHRNTYFRAVYDEADRLVERFLEIAHMRGIPSARRGIYTLVR